MIDKDGDKIKACTNCRRLFKLVLLKKSNNMPKCPPCFKAIKKVKRVK